MFIHIFKCADIAELRRLAALTERTNVRELLEAEAGRREIIVNSNSSAPFAEVPPASALPSPTPQPVAVGAAPSPSISYTEPKYGFSAEGDFVEILVLDLNGVGSLPKEQVTCDFTATSFDLRVHGLNGKNYRVLVPALEKEITAKDSKLVMGKNRVTIKLKKQNSWDYWTQLASKKGPKSASEKASKQAEDPMGGLMDIMKDMYQSGDDATKKMIAEAWTKSREGGAGAGSGFGGGAGGFPAAGMPGMGAFGGSGMGGNDDLDL